MKDKVFIMEVIRLNQTDMYPEDREDELNELCKKYIKDNEERNNKPEYINACGSCKYFKDAIPNNRLWYTCQHSPYKKDGKGHKVGDLRGCYASMNRCCYYEKED